MNKICYGCGSILQTDDKDKKGYIPSNKIDNSSYCMRCFRMMHYGENKDVDTPKDIKEIIRKVNKDNKFVIFLTDFLNINKDVIDIFNMITNNKLLVINKGELINKELYKDKFINYIKDYYMINTDIKIKGGKNYHGVSSIYKYLMNNNIHEAYLLGISNSGKSTFINDLSLYLESNIDKITVNSKANTTLDFIRVKLNKDLTLIDSPGFILDNLVQYDVTDNIVKAYTYNMKENEVISILNNKYYIKFDNNTSITFYTNITNNNLITKYYKDIHSLDTSIDCSGNIDIVIKGIGFIRIKNICNIKTNIDNKYLEIRKSMFS